MEEGDTPPIEGGRERYTPYRGWKREIHPLKRVEEGDTPPKEGGRGRYTLYRGWKREIQPPIEGDIETPQKPSGYCYIIYLLIINNNNNNNLQGVTLFNSI